MKRKRAITFMSCLLGLSLMLYGGITPSYALTSDSIVDKEAAKLIVELDANKETFIQKGDITVEKLSLEEKRNSLHGLSEGELANTNVYIVHDKAEQSKSAFIQAALSSDIGATTSYAHIEVYTKMWYDTLPYNGEIYCKPIKIGGYIVSQPAGSAINKVSGYYSAMGQAINSQLQPSPQMPAYTSPKVTYSLANCKTMQSTSVSDRNKYYLSGNGDITIVKAYYRVNYTLFGQYTNTHDFEVQL